MKYVSIFFTILIVWVAIILIALTVHDTSKIFQLYLLLIVFTMTLFIIGFASKK